MDSLCELFGVTKQAYYKRDEELAARRIAQEDLALKFIKQTRVKDPGLGGNKLWRMYRREFEAGDPIGRDHFTDLIDRYGLKVRKRVRKPRTTDSTHGLPLYPNIVKDFIPSAPNQLWVSDITYITIWPSYDRPAFCYLSLVMDAYSKEIVGWHVGPKLDTEYTLRALSMALEHLGGGDGSGLIHHSDRGCQYASHIYIGRLREHGIRPSMTESGDPKDNAMAERVNSTIKNELLKGMTFSNISQVNEALGLAISFYNEERPHMSLDMKTPREASICEGELSKKWTSRRELYLKGRSDACDIPE